MRDLHEFRLNIYAALEKKEDSERNNFLDELLYEANSIMRIKAIRQFQILNNIKKIYE